MTKIVVRSDSHTPAKKDFDCISKCAGGSVLLIMEHMLTFGILAKTPTHPQKLSKSTKSTFRYFASSTPTPLKKILFGITVTIFLRNTQLKTKFSSVLPELYLKIVFNNFVFKNFTKIFQNITGFSVHFGAAPQN